MVVSMEPSSNIQAAALPRQLRRVDTFLSTATPLLVRPHRLNGDYEVHSHDFMEIVFVVAGTGHHFTQYGEEELGAGDVLCLRPGAWHAYRGCTEMALYNCCFAVELLEKPLAWLRDDPVLARLFWGTLDAPSELRVAQLSPATQQQCSQVLDHLHACIRADPAGADVLTLFGYLFILLSRLKTALPAVPIPPRHHAVQAAQQVLKDHMAQPWTLDKLANRVQLDPAYLVRLFSTQVGAAPMTWLTQQRIACAVTLLANTDLPIGQIATQVGWPDPNHFARRFRTLMGISATHYRTQLQSQLAQPDITHPPRGERDR